MNQHVSFAAVKQVAGCGLRDKGPPAASWPRSCGSMLAACLKCRDHGTKLYFLLDCLDYPVVVPSFTGRLPLALADTYQLTARKRQATTWTLP